MLELIAPIDSLFGWIHFVIALLAVALAPIVFLRKKGTRFHKLIGRVWMTAMLIVNISAWLIFDLTGGPSFFHLMSLLNLAALLPSIWAIRTYQKTRDPKHLALHARTAVWAYFGVCAAGVAQVLVSAPPSFLEEGWMSSVALGVGIFAAGGMLSFITRRILPPIVSRYSGGDDPPGR